MIRRFKITANPALSQEQLDELYSLGCEPPYAKVHVTMLAASCTDEQAEALRWLDHVISVKPMPTYRI
jgi:hypothetical protein